MDIMKLIGSILCVIGMILVPFLGIYSSIVLYGMVGILILLQLFDAIKRTEPKEEWLGPLPDVPPSPPDMPSASPQPRQDEHVAPLTNSKPISSPLTCNFCGKEVENEKKLKRHIGMAHYEKIQV